MCGIAGFVDFRPAAEAQLLRQAKAMAQCLAYRGPDDSAEWAEADAGFATGHRRLSVVDLSPAGAQPMVSHCGRFVLSYNGEVYNAAEMRAELQPKGHAFRGHSDTEVMLAAVAQWGIGAAVKRFIGMFAFALWDRRDRRLWLVRDRLGIKPLYWGQFGRLLVFASELKALRAHPGWQPEVDRDSVAAYLRFAYVPSPRSIYRGINKLPPGTILEIDERGECKIEAFWSLADVVREGQQQPFVGTDAEAESELTRLLGDAVERRMIADVPLGAFLSGGIDSSLVVALMQSKSNRPVRTFSIGFREQGYDEAPHAAAVAKHLGTDHTEFYVTSEDARGVIPKLADMYDEPFADSSQIPTYLISELTRRKVTVALSGDGGDELFCGYNRYLQAALHRTWLATVPRPLRSVAAKTIRTLPSAFWDRTLQFMKVPQASNKVSKLAQVLSGTDDDFYLQVVSQWLEPNSMVKGGSEPDTVIRSPAAAALVPDFVARMQYLDTLTYLPDDILTKVDRASMAVSLEVRVPIIDHRVVALAWRLPSRMRLHDGQSKWILRRILSRFVPETMTERHKMGFGIPVGAWLRGPLRDWAESHLSEAALTRDNLLDPGPIRQRWDAHVRGRENWEYPLWTILMLQAWRAKYG